MRRFWSNWCTQKSEVNYLLFAGAYTTKISGIIHTSTDESQTSFCHRANILLLDSTSLSHAKPGKGKHMLPPRHTVLYEGSQHIVLNQCSCCFTRHVEESVNCSLPPSWVHTGPWLVSASVIDREERLFHPCQVLWKETFIKHFWKNFPGLSLCRSQQRICYVFFSLG